MMFLPLLLLPLLSVHAQTQEMSTYEAGAAKTTYTLTQDDIDNWTNATALFSEINNAFTSASKSVSYIYSFASDSSVAETMAAKLADCPIDTYQAFLNNSTKTLEYICCHLANIWLPGLTGFAANLFNTAFANSMSINSGDISLLIYNLHYMKQNEIIGMKSGACKNDLSYHVPEQNYARSIAAQKLGDSLLKNYIYTANSLDSIGTCFKVLNKAQAFNTSVDYDYYKNNPNVTANTTAALLANFTQAELVTYKYCSNLLPFTAERFPIITEFTQIDSLYATTCSAEARYDFEELRALFASYKNNEGCKFFRRKRK